MQIDVKNIAKVTKTPSWKSHCNLSKTFLRTDHWGIQNWLMIFKKIMLCFSAEICHDMSFLKAQVSFDSNFTSIFITTKHQSSVLFLAQTLHTLVKSSPLKSKFLRFSSAQFKICQIPYVSFELTSQFLFNFCTILHFHDTQLPCNF